MYRSGIELPKVAFSVINFDKIQVGSFFVGFNLDNSGKLSKMDHLGNITVIENGPFGTPNPQEIFVDANVGSDIDGDGSSIRPYQTIQHAVTFCTDPTKIYTLVLACANYTGADATIPGNVNIEGNGASIQFNLTLGSVGLVGSQIQPFYVTCGFQEFTFDLSPFSIALPTFDNCGIGKLIRTDTSVGAYLIRFSDGSCANFSIKGNVAFDNALFVGLGTVETGGVGFFKNTIIGISIDLEANSQAVLLSDVFVAPGGVLNALDPSVIINIDSTSASGFGGTIVGTTNINYLDNAESIKYTPTTPANWPTVPDTVQEGLDYLRSSGIIVSGTGTGSAQRCGNNNNASGNYSTTLGQCNTASACSSTVGGGECNLANSPYSTIGGGYLNTTASSYYSYNTISGGFCNFIQDDNSTIGGGTCNTAIGSNGTISGGYGNYVFGGASVGGGTSNCASGNLATIAGGQTNLAIGNCSTISGGKTNAANCNFSTISGGQCNLADREWSIIGGGFSNSAFNCYSTIGGGALNRACGIGSTVSGGYVNCAIAALSIVGGGCNNKSCGFLSTVSGGKGNTASALYSTVAGGCGNSAQGCNSFVGGGIKNTACLGSAVVGGASNSAQGCGSAVVGGLNNAAVACGSFIGGGCCNSVTTASCNSAILGGICNSTGEFKNSFIVGTCITSDRQCTTFVNNLSIVNVPNSDPGTFGAVWWDSANCSLRVSGCN